MFSRRKRSNININSINYEILTICSNTPEKMCIKTDECNNKLYIKAIKTFCKQNTKCKNQNINIDIEKPPIPTNYDRLIQYRKNNILKPSYKQSEATIYLYQKGYVLDKDYTACDAIQYAKKIKKQNKKYERVNIKRIYSSNKLIIEKTNPIIINDITPKLNRKLVYPQILNQPEYIQEINPNDYNDEPTYGFSNININKKNVIPSAPPYEESNYVYNYESNC
jgi:hypothetical protein